MELCSDHQGVLHRPRGHGGLLGGAQRHPEEAHQGISGTGHAQGGYSSIFSERWNTFFLYPLSIEKNITQNTTKKTFM